MSDYWMREATSTGHLEGDAAIMREGFRQLTDRYPAAARLFHRVDIQGAHAGDALHELGEKNATGLPWLAEARAFMRGFMAGYATSSADIREHEEAEDYSYLFGPLMATDTRPPAAPSVKAYPRVMYERIKDDGFSFRVVATDLHRFTLEYAESRDSMGQLAWRSACNNRGDLKVEGISYGVLIMLLTSALGTALEDNL